MIDADFEIFFSYIIVNNLSSYLNTDKQVYMYHNIM